MVGLGDFARRIDVLVRGGALVAAVDVFEDLTAALRTGARTEAAMDVLAQATILLANHAHGDLDTLGNLFDLCDRLARDVPGSDAIRINLAAAASSRAHAIYTYSTKS